MHETIVLNAENDWNYKWTDTESGNVWTVAEKNTSDTYDPAVSVRGHTFTLTNTYIPPIGSDDVTEPTTESTDPTGSSDSTDSTTSPTDPTDSTTSPTDPTDSTESTKSTEPTTKPNKPGKPSNPTNRPPKTGDSFPLIPCCMVMCICGFLLLILGIWRRRFIR